MPTNKEILQLANDAIKRGDHEGFLSFCADDIEWTFVGDKTLHGKNAVREWMKSEYRQPPEFKVTNLIAENDFLTAIGEIALNDNDGTKIEYWYCDVWRFRDEKFVELRAFVVRK